MTKRSRKNVDESEVSVESDADGVGYKRPPIGTRFQKGSSGNPKGRPKSSRKGLATQVADFMSEKITVLDREITWLEALIARLKKSALGGDPKSLESLSELTGEGIVMPGGHRIAERELQSVIESEARRRADEMIKDQQDEHEMERDAEWLIKEIERLRQNSKYAWRLVGPNHPTSN